MLFPDIGPQYYSEKDKGILDRMQNCYAESISVNQSFWAEADTDTRFFVGDQTLWNDIGYGNLPANKRRQFNFNRIRRIVNMIGGYQRRNRKSTIVVPIENSDAQTADQFTKIIMWNDQQEGVLETISDAFEGALVSGMNFLHVWVDYRSDPISGNIRVDRKAYNSVLMDPFFRKADLSDCNYLWTRSFVTRREALSLLPDMANDITDIMGEHTRDDKFQFMPETYGFGMKNLLAYDEYHYRTYRTQKLLVDSKSGMTVEWKSRDEDKLKAYLQYYPDVIITETEVPTVNTAIVVQGRVMYHGPNPLGIDVYPFIPVFGYYVPELPYFPFRIQGVVRGLRDAQYLYNRRKVIELDILESQINSGWVFKENALKNPQDVFMTGQGKGLCVNKNAQMTDVVQIQPPQIPPSMMQLSELLGREIMEISGVNEELLGSAVDEKAGILAQLRQGAGLTTLQGLFDNLDHSQKLLGKLRLDIIQANFTPGKVERITKEIPMPQFHNKAFGRYDAVVQEGLNTATQRQMQFAQLLQLREAGVPIPSSLLVDSCTLQDKKKLMDALNQQEQQQQQAQQMQLQSELQEQQARIQLAQSRAVADQGLGMERLSRIQENKAMAVERRAAAVRDEDEAFLNMVKALKEIDTYDVDHLDKMLNMMNIIKQQEQQVSNESKMKETQ